MADMRKRVESFLKKKESSNFPRNGGLLMEKLISLSNGRDEIHIRRFTIEEITKFTNNFAETFMDDGFNTLFKGNLDGCPILVQIFDRESIFIDHHKAVFATAISALMSHLKYTLKLIGCCTDYDIPAQVYEYSGNATLTDLLGEDQAVALSWGHRIKIARDVAAMVVYLHTSFPVAIIHRDLKPSNVLIDRNGDAKLFDFTLAIEIPKGESQEESNVSGTFAYLDPEYAMTGIVTTKSDVYSFGVILLMLLAGNKRQRVIYPTEKKLSYIREYVEQFVDVEEKLIDQNISQGVGIEEFRAIKDLALSCTEAKADHRPEMTDVARRIHEMEKQVSKPSLRIVHPLEDNQTAVRKKLMVLSNGKYKEIPFRIFSSKEIINGTDNFQECLSGDTYYGTFKGYLHSCPVLVKKWEVLEASSFGSLRHEAVFEAAFGTWGSLDPDYVGSKFVSIKTDVYSFGVLLLALLTGMKAFWLNSEGNLISLTQFVEQVIREGQSDSLVDPRILQDVEMTEFEAVLNIGRMCTRIRGKDRPEMIDVARLLHQIGKDATRINSEYCHLFQFLC